MLVVLCVLSDKSQIDITAFPARMLPRLIVVIFFTRLGYAEIERLLTRFALAIEVLVLLLLPVKG